jgi:hypothetical protein
VRTEIILKAPASIATPAPQLSPPELPPHSTQLPLHSTPLNSTPADTVLNKGRGLTKEKKAMMFKVDEDRTELFQNILPQYAVYLLVQAVREVSNTIHDKHLSLGP